MKKHNVSNLDHTKMGEIMKEYSSIWQKNINFEKESNKWQDSCDILIVGGGITGTSLAYFLSKKKQNVMLVDKGLIGCGITAMSTAKISYLQGTVYQTLEKQQSLAISRAYFTSQKETMKDFVQFIHNEKIDCDLEKNRAYLFATEPSNSSKVDKEKTLLETFGVTCHEAKQLPIPFPCHRAFYVEDSYVFHPLKYIQELKKRLTTSIAICENTLVTDIKPQGTSFIVTTSRGQITCHKVVITCHYPFFIRPGYLPLKNYIEREYVTLGEVVTPLPFSAINVDQKTQSLRFYQDYVLYVSHNHRLTNQLDYQQHYWKSRKDFYNHFQKKPLSTWINQDLMTNDHLPFIGPPKKENPNLLIATGYNAWGMTNGFLAAKILSNYLSGQKNPYQTLFSVTRKNLTGIMQSTIDSFFYAKAYLETAFLKQENPYTATIDGQKYLVYIDDNQQKHIVKNLCPHMKCHLIFNKEELTWDCPCHGSRFNLDGQLLTGPSKENIKIEKKPHHK